MSLGKYFIKKELDKSNVVANDDSNTPIETQKKTNY